MAQDQCPNCGGYKTHNWKTDWAAMTFVITPMTAVVLMVLASFSAERTVFIGAILVIYTVIFLFKCVEYLIGPKKSHVCQICEYNWESEEAPKTMTPRPGLIEKGNALLEREAAAAAVREEEHRRDEDHRRYARQTD